MKGPGTETLFMFYFLVKGIHSIFLAGLKIETRQLWGKEWYNLTGQKVHFLVLKTKRRAQRLMKFNNLSENSCDANASGDPKFNSKRFLQHANNSPYIST